MCNTISLVHCFVPADSGVKLTKCEGSEGTMCESAEKLPISEARSPPDAIRTPGGGLYLLISALARVRAPWAARVPSGAARASLERAPVDPRSDPVRPFRTLI